MGGAEAQECDVDLLISGKSSSVTPIIAYIMYAFFQYVRMYKH